MANETIIKPKYNGSFVGQVFKTNGAIEIKRTAYEVKDKETQEYSMRYGSYASQQFIELIWDGKDWVSRKDFLFNIRNKKKISK